MSETVQKDHQALVQQPLEANLSPPLVSQGKLVELMARMASQRKVLADKMSELSKIREEDKGSNFVTAWLNNTDDKLKDGQLDMMASLSGLQSVSAELLEANASISNVLLAQQDTLLQQQCLLEEQTQQLNKQGELLGAQQESHRDEVEKLLESNRCLDQASREAMGLAERLVAGIADLEAAEQRALARADSQREDLGAQIRMLRWGLGLALMLSFGAMLMPFVWA